MTTSAKQMHALLFFFPFFLCRILWSSQDPLLRIFETLLTHTLYQTLLYPAVPKYLLWGIFATFPSDRDLYVSYYHLPSHHRACPSFILLCKTVSLTQHCCHFFDGLCHGFPATKHLFSLSIAYYLSSRPSHRTYDSLLALLYAFPLCGPPTQNKEIPGLGCHDQNNTAQQHWPASRNSGVGKVYCLSRGWPNSTCYLASIPRVN